MITWMPFGSGSPYSHKKYSKGDLLWRKGTKYSNHRQSRGSLMVGDHPQHDRLASSSLVKGLARQTSLHLWHFEKGLSWGSNTIHVIRYYLHSRIRFLITKLHLYTVCQQAMIDTPNNYITLS